MSYFTHCKREWNGDAEDSYDWVQHTWRNLAFHYGPERASRIISGQDPQTQTDIRRWENLGRRGGQAA